MNDFRDAIDKINELIRAGQSDAARAQLDKVCRLSPPPRIAFALAELAKRLGQSNLAVRLLSPLVQSNEGLTGSDYERAEYALNLMRLGGRQEAETILQKIDAKKCPVVSLYRAWGAQLKWDQAQAISHFKEYLTWKEAPIFQQLVAKVNLCQALVAEEKFSDPELKIDELVRLTAEKSHGSLHLQLLQLGAQACLLKGELGQAHDWIAKAEGALGNQSGPDLLGVKKWRMVLELASEKDSPNGKAANEALRREALKRKDWETVRDCDRALAIWAKDMSAAERVLFGTPFEAYRKRLLLSLGEKFRPSAHFDRKLGPPGSAPVMVLATGEIEGAPGSVKVGQAVHRLLSAVASDHYRPLPLVGIFSAVYPGESYHPITSPMRVHRVIQRFRAWAKETNLPLEIEYHSEGYSLTADRPLVLRQELGNASPSREKVWVDKVRELSRAQPFTRAEVETWLGISQTSAHRFLKQASEDGYFQPKGAGNAKKYIWAVPKKLAA